MNLNDHLRQLRESLQKMQGHSNAEIVDALRDVARILDVFSDQQKLLVTTEIQKLQIKEGDALIVKLGDRATGWIPAPEAEKQAMELFTDLMQSMKLDVPVLVYHYGVELETIQRDLKK